MVLGCQTTSKLIMASTEEKQTQVVVAKTAEDIDEAYSSPPWWYDLRGVCILTLTYKQTIDMVVKFFAKNIGNRHIEVACGTGTLLKMLVDWRKNHRLPKSELIVGLDYAESMIRGAQKRFKHKKNMEMIKGDALAVPYPDHSFDTCNIANAVHCFPEAAGALREVLRVLRPGGLFAANVLLEPHGSGKDLANKINTWGIKKGILVKTFKLEEIKQLYAEIGFAIVKEKVVGNCWNVIAKKPE
jgi:ubiquinone/menaquinone biosynthesis C-methylase UbiE